MNIITNLDINILDNFIDYHKNETGITITNYNFGIEKPNIAMSLIRFFNNIIIEDYTLIDSGVELKMNRQLDVYMENDLMYSKYRKIVEFMKVDNDMGKFAENLWSIFFTPTPREVINHIPRYRNPDIAKDIILLFRYATEISHLNAILNIMVSYFITKGSCNGYIDEDFSYNPIDDFMLTKSISRRNINEPKMKRDLKNINHTLNLICAKYICTINIDGSKNSYMTRGMLMKVLRMGGVHLLNNTDYDPRNIMAYVNIVWDVNNKPRYSRRMLDKDLREIENDMKGRYFSNVNGKYQLIRDKKAKYNIRIVNTIKPKRRDV